MEAIDVELNDFALRCRSLTLSHVASSLPRGLEPGEQVILHDRARGYFSAHVSDLEFELADTVYRLTLGVRLSREEALERFVGAPVPATGPVTKQGLLDLLGQLRAMNRTVPEGPQVEGRADTAL